MACVWVSPSLLNILVFVGQIWMFLAHMVCYVRRRSGGHIPWHEAVNKTICHALVSKGVPAVLEPVGVCRDDGKRLDGMTLIPWERGLSLVWGFTCSDTLAPSNFSTSSSGASRLANSAKAFKIR